ncbi:methyltransferase-like protein 7B isoform X3 [Chenopodium quinoa]|uniref:methyltransferase-like protein 7B isoform X3 n=1 Tax=Chenopodium quinoa TaxID=63459 RepID=UPI000B7996EB|nr:methyltransferase-like protein 7B isoform X3 [Chenopodium quinoa]
MIHSILVPTSNLPIPFQFSTKNTKSQFKSSSNCTKINKDCNLIHTRTGQNPQKPIFLQSLGLCKCGRRHFMETIASTVLHTSLPSLAFELEPNSSSHGYKSQLFDKLNGQTKEVLEIGVGTGTNFKYYASDARMVFGIDPNRKMEKYTRRAADAAGLSPEKFKFVQAVGEALPLDDASVDTVIGTLVLCSVKDVPRTLQEIKRVLKPGGLYLFVEHVAAKDGTSLRLLQKIFNPLQQLLADGCHLTRETEKHISEAGFSSVNTSTSFISSALFINPHLYGIAHK